MVSPFFGIVVPFTVFWLGGSERRKWPAECKLAQRFWRCPRRVRCDFYGSLSQLQRWLENVLRVSPTRSQGTSRMFY